MHYALNMEWKAAIFAAHNPGYSQVYLSPLSSWSCTWQPQHEMKQLLAEQERKESVGAIAAMPTPTPSSTAT